MKKTKMMFIYLDTGGNSISFSPAIEILSSYLKQRGFKTGLIHLHDSYGIPLNLELIYQKISDFNPDVIGFTATLFQYHASNQFAGQLKEHGVKVPIILGGVHATISPEDLVDSNFDAFCIGEGELPLVELLEKIEKGDNYKTIPGFYFKHNGRIIKNPPGKILENLDELPYRDYDIMNARKILKVRNKWLSIAFSRGCPYSCTFCINQKLRKVYQASSKKSYFRCQSVDRAINELVHWVEYYEGQIDVINLDDDLLMLNRDWFLEFAGKYRDQIFQKYQIQYAINGRVNLIDEDIVKMLKTSGCHLLRMGFESGDAELRNLILGKDLTDEKFYYALDLCNKYQLRSLLFAMLGVPEESVASVKKTLAMLRKLQPTLIRMAFFEPFKGTSLYDYCVEKNLFIKGLKVKNCFTETSLRFEKISSKELLQYHLMFPWYLNLGFVESNSEDYQALTEHYEQLSEEELRSKETRQEILIKDQKISQIMTDNGLKHFAYFDKNPYYYHLKN